MEAQKLKAVCPLCGHQARVQPGQPTPYHQSKGGCASTGPEPLMRCNATGAPAVVV